jgi:Fic-DOC domain mobile mystery protein B
MIGLFDAIENATPLSHEARNGLIPTHVTLRSELNELEQNNIGQADGWVFLRKRNVLDESFLKGLHKRMFKDVWRWAGDYRKTEVEFEFGALPHLIQPGVYQIVGDMRYALQHKSFEPDELALRLSHRLVSVHPFANGNGRWSRLVGDLMVVKQGGKRFTWGSADLQAESKDREKYIRALKAEDNHDYKPLIEFARS